MANVMLAARTAAASSFNAVADTAETISATVQAARFGAATLRAHAQAYHDRALLDIADEQDNLILRREAERAIEDAKFYRQLNKDLADPELKQLYDQAQANRQKLREQRSAHLKIAAE